MVINSTNTTDKAVENNSTLLTLKSHYALETIRVYDTETVLQRE